MPRFRPFSGLRYEADLVSLEDVIAPPYDVVDDAGRAQLASRSEYNSILVELPVEDASSGSDRYHVAATLLSNWREKGVLVRDPVASFYGYRMSYVSDEGEKVETTGVLGALEILEPGSGGILPHEETMPKPKGDRLFLLRATRTNLSPIWGLSMASGLTELCVPDEGDSEVVSAVDDEGVTHSLWRISSQDRCAAIGRAVASTPVVIADGHHRFETALAYRGESGAAGEIADASGGGEGAVMAFVVELTPEQLHVRSIHRVVSGLPAGFDVRAAVEGTLASEPFEGDLASLSPEYLASRSAVAVVTGQGAWLLRDDAPVGGSTGGDVLAELDSVRLRTLLDTFPLHEVDYEPRWDIALAAVTSGRAEAAFMIRPVTVDQIGRAAHAGLRMPPKTTFFHPKPRTGMVFRSLD